MFDGTSNYHVKDVGRILLEVQQNLKQLREQITGDGSEDGGAASGAGAGVGGFEDGGWAPPVDPRLAQIDKLDAVLRQAEADLKVKAEVVLNSVVQNSVKTVGSGRLPAVPGATGGAVAGAGAAGAGTGLVGSLAESAPAGLIGTAPRRRGGAKSLEAGLSKRRERTFDDVTSGDGREYFRKKFGIPFISEVDKGHMTRSTERQVGKRSGGGRLAPNKTVASMKLLPAVNRRDPGAPPPPITADDVNKGIFSLIERGLLPSHVDVTQAFAEGQTLTAGQAPVHDWSEQFAPSQTYVSPFGFSVTNLKLDFAAPAPPPGRAAAERAAKMRESPVPSPERAPKPATNTLEYAGPVASTERRKPRGQPRPPSPITSPEHKSETEPSRPKPGPAKASKDAASADMHAAVDKIRGYNELLDEYSLHQFIIRRGKVLDTTPEFHSFKRINAPAWGPITLVVSALERLLTDFAVPTAYIDGQAVALLASDEIAAASPTRQQLLRCIANIDQVAPLLRKPGQRFKGPDGPDNAATAIQATWRMFVVRGNFTGARAKRAAARKIQHRWRGFAMFKATRLRMRNNAERMEDEWRAMMEKFRKEWPSLSRKRRVVIHVPSISAEEHVRLGIPRYSTRQNLQMARLCAVADPLVDVVYVSPYNLTDDLYSYYTKLLQIGGVHAANARFKIVVPENLSRFPDTMSLTQVLLYSPRAMKRIRHFVKGKDAYIVPGHVGPEDKRLSMLLKMPLLAPDPAMASLYATKSGSKRVFAMANVNIPPGAHDIFEEKELVAALAKLITANIHVERWLFKIDDEFGGRGHAYFDVATLKTVQMLRREKATKPTGAWSDLENQRKVREIVLQALHKKLARRVVVTNPLLYDSWASFVRAFCRLGGVIEAARVDVLGSPSVNLFISPTGSVSVTSTHEQLFGQPYVQMGYRFPADSVPYEALAGASTAVGKHLAKLGVMGYVGIDYVTFFDDGVGAQRLWAVDLNLRLTSSACSFGLFNFLMRGRLDPASGQYLIPDTDAATAGGGRGGGSGASVASGAGSTAKALTGGDSVEARLAAAEGDRASTARTESAMTASTMALPEDTRTYVALDFMYHPNLSSLQYASFFNMCRLQGISFDLQERVGTAFVLVDSLAGGVLGMLCAGRSPEDSTRTIIKALEFIASQVGSRAAKGEFDEEDSNFSDIVAMVRTVGKTMARKRRELAKEAEGAGK